MRVDRRTFLLGVGATLAAAAPITAAAQKFTGEVSMGLLHPKIPYRAIHSLTFSCMPSGEEVSKFVEDPVLYRFFRNEHCVYQAQLNPRASMRWVALDGCEIIIRGKDVLKLDVEPCWTNTSICIESDTNEERPSRDDPFPERRIISETFTFRDGVCQFSDIASFDPRLSIPTKWLSNH